MIFRNQSRSFISLVFQIIFLLTFWIDSLLTWQDSEAFSYAIQYMQQEWDQAHASQAAHEIASSISIASLPIPPPDVPAHVAEAAYDPLAPSSTDSGN